MAGQAAGTALAPDPARNAIQPPEGLTTVSAPKLPPRDLYGHACVGGTDTTMWGTPTLTLYGTADKPQMFAARPMAGTVAFYPARIDLVRFARELLAFLGEDYGVTLPPWRPASADSGARPWFLTRYSSDQDQSVPVEDRYHFGSRGVLIRYASMAAAQRAADELNAAEREASADDSTRALDALAGILSQDWPGNWQTAIEQREALIRVLRGTGRMLEASS
jgi:hypothetical protein